MQWASNPRNSIILTSRPSPSCLARSLIDNLKMPSIEIEVSYRHYRMCWTSMETFIQRNLCIEVTLGPTFNGCIIEGGCIIEVHNTLAICTLGPNKVALLERLAAL